MKEAGEKLINLLTPGNANAGEELKKHVQEVGLGNPNITATVELTAAGQLFLVTARTVVEQLGGAWLLACPGRSRPIRKPCHERGARRK